ncbi:MAG: hypothetical protein NVS2B3_15200 [Vulcanimicrobiaceae bacterium]
MPSLDKVQTEIKELEGFAVDIRVDANEPALKLRSYKRRYERRARERHTVADWKRLRFESAYPDFDVNVLLSDGRVASDRMMLARVRQSYS